MDIVPKLFRRAPQEPRKHAALYKPLYRDTCTPDSEWQRGKLEQLRYKWGGYKNGLRVMQRLHDWYKSWTSS